MARRSVLANNVPRVHRPRDPAEYGEQDVQAEGAPAAVFEEHGEGRQEEREEVEAHVALSTFKSVMLKR